ncbi:MAG: T9SS type A sorting domain-containing protein [Melioribacteraceae bacterium]|nr:T9SS type A sorting domain-containing protein [Melioribacteraceae bacterium]
MKNIQYFFLILFVFFFASVSQLSAQDNLAEPTLAIYNICDLQVPFQNNIVLPTFEMQNRPRYNLAGEWKKERVPRPWPDEATTAATFLKRDADGIAQIEANSGNRYKLGYDDSNWETKNIPFPENKFNEYPIRPDFYEDLVWYRKSFIVNDPTLANHQVYLKFLSVNYMADVWVNGIWVGYHEGGYTPFAFDVTQYLNKSGNNVIAVRVDNPSWGSTKYSIPNTRSDWYNYTGIIHDVYLEFVNPVFISRTDITPLNINGEILAKVVVSNRKLMSTDITASIQIYNIEFNESNIGREDIWNFLDSEAEVTGNKEFTSYMDFGTTYAGETKLKIEDPRLWTHKNPNLYVMKVTLFEAGVKTDEYYTQFGIRTVKTVGAKFLFNDRLMYLPGVARHEDHPDYGRSVPREQILEDMKIVKSLNTKLLRTAHYPNHYYTYLIADRLGISTKEEIPVFWFNDSESWRIQNDVRQIHKQMFREMVYKDYNRPSVIIWSLSNECKDIPGRLAYNEMMMKDHADNYEDGRLVTQSAAADSPGAADPTIAPLDLASWTIYFGIFYGKGGAYYGPTFTFLRNAMTSFPNKPILCTEYGYWSSENGSTSDIQNTVFNDMMNVFKIFALTNADGSENKAFGSLLSAVWWTVFDWYRMDNAGGFQSMGLYSMQRKSKPVANSLSAAYYPYYSQDGILVDVDKENKAIPIEYNLEQNFPNPFNPTTNIKYNLPKAGLVKIEVFDILGNKINTLINSYQDIGSHQIEFKGGNISSGVYFYVLSVNGNSLTKKMMLLK